MHSVFIPNRPDAEGLFAIISAEDVHHLRDVLRLAPGDEIEVVAEEQRYRAVIDRVGDTIDGHVLEAVAVTTESPLVMDLYQGLAKGEKMEWVLQKGVELGLGSYFPVATKRSVVKLSGPKADKKVERWQRIAEAAGKQSKRLVLTEVGPVLDLAAVIERIEDYDLFLVAYEGVRDRSLKEVLASEKGTAARVGFFVGPEGGFDEEEIEALESAGAHVVGLGPRILRTETAPLVLLSILGWEWGDLS